ncbi:MAG: outer membrane protein assembly factor BamD [Alphaproteobacteria bacterium]|nr:outer membrane protein assembly factor BamD [Alphaproteobacteria bacterium]
MKISSKIVCVALACVLSGCAGAPENRSEMPPEKLYAAAQAYFKKTDYEKAAEYFDEVEKAHPYSEWAARASIMSAYSFYKRNAYDDAVLALDRFIQLHPGNRNTPYAYYLKGLCFYEQMSDAAREQKMTEQAVATFEEMLARHPNAIYAADARAKLAAAYDCMAGQEMAVGRYYLRRCDYMPALNRFQAVVEGYPGTNQVPEAMYRMGVSYAALGMVDMAEKTMKRMAERFPKSEWTQALMKDVKKAK